MNEPNRNKATTAGQIQTDKKKILFTDWGFSGRTDVIHTPFSKFLELHDLISLVLNGSPTFFFCVYLLCSLCRPIWITWGPANSAYLFVFFFFSFLFCPLFILTRSMPTAFFFSIRTVGFTESNWRQLGHLVFCLIAAGWEYAAKKKGGCDAFRHDLHQAVFCVLFIFSLLYISMKEWLYYD